MTSKLALLGILFLYSPFILAAEPYSIKSGPFQTAVVELYTSEGCSSCPPADRWLGKLIDIPQQDLDVLALAFHVDYWDYIGWKDEFASPRFTDRQRKLGRLNRQNSIYTPEFFVDGLEARGTHSILEKIRTANQTPSPVNLELQLQHKPTHYLLDLAAHSKTPKSLRVQYVLFEDQLQNQVNAGENEGKKLHHQRVVRYLSKPQKLSTQQQHKITIKPGWKPANLGIGALVTSSDEEYVQSVYTLLNSYP